MKQPHFIIIGAMKSATTTLHRQLASQPGIFMTPHKEPNFFSDDDQHRRGPGYYLGLFNDSGESDLRGESSTHYTKLPDYPRTIERMTALLPSLKLIYVMRHPVDRLVSHYIHQWTQNVIRCDINEALDPYPELISYSRYSYQLKPYFDAYGQGAVLPVFFEALKQNPQRELERVAEFIGYDDEVVWDDRLRSQNVSSERIRRFRGYGMFIDPPPMACLRRTFVPRAMRNAVKSRLRMDKPPALNDANLSRLCDVFDEDLVSLSGWLGADLTCETFNDRTSQGGLDWRGFT